MGRKVIISLFILGLFFIGLIGIVSAIPNPSLFYCENMGYTYNNTHCIFSDGKTCKLWDFYNGDCGQGYIRVLDCIELGGSLEPGYECCEGLVQIYVSEYREPGICSMMDGAWPICLACGDGVCDSEIENECNCAGDCSGNKCIPEGQTQQILSDDKCCGDLVEITKWAKCQDGSCDCIQPVGYGPLCSDCGNGVCETWESKCNCAEDCAETECSEGDTQKHTCEDGSEVVLCFCDNNNMWACVNTLPEVLCGELFQCDDSDNGKDYYVKGSVNPHCTAPCGVFIDTCQDSKTLIEYFCGVSEPETEIYVCPNKCEDGACIGSVTSVKAGLERKKEETIEHESGEEVHLKLMENNQIRITSGDTSAYCDCELKQEEINNQVRLKIELSNGRNSEIKIMPDAASERALERLKIRVCSEANNCVIELKEVRQGNEVRAAYEIQAERHAKLLGIFRLKMQAKAQVDAETGEIIRIKKPWWAFLASEPEE